MKTRRPITRLRPARVRRSLAVAATAAITMAGVSVLASVPAYATDTSTLTVSNNAASATGVTYTWAFTTTADLTPNSITLTVPSTTSGTPTISPYGLTGCTVTGGGSAITGAEISLTISSCAGVIKQGTPIAIEASGLTNPAVTDPDFSTDDQPFASTVTYTDGTTSQTFGPTVNFSDNTTGVTVIVPESLTFTNNGPTSITMVPIPGSTNAASAAVSLTVGTNAASGYTLSGCVKTDFATTGGATLSQASPTPTAFSLTGTVNAGFGATVAAVKSTDTGAIGTPSIGFHWSGSLPAGYSDSCTSTAVDGSSNHNVVAYDSGPATGDNITLTNQAVVTQTQTAGSYTGTITYMAYPKY